MIRNNSGENTNSFEISRFLAYFCNPELISFVMKFNSLFFSV